MKVYLEISHPIFGDDCQLEIDCNLSYYRPNYIDGCMESPGGAELNYIETLNINSKKYAKNIMESMNTFIMNNNDFELNQAIDDYAE